jgi:uncharacterized membrane protein YtjA (UPF0391 family)
MPVRMMPQLGVHKSAGETHHTEGNPVLYYAIVFLIIAIVAGILGFGTLSGTAAWIAKVLVVVFLVLFVVSLIRGKK